MDIKELFDSSKFDTTNVSLTRLKIQGLEDIIDLHDLKKSGIHFYLDGKKDWPDLLLPKFYATLVVASEGAEHDNWGEEYNERGEYNFVFKMAIPLKQDPSLKQLYYFWFVINNVDGIYVQMIVPPTSSDSSEDIREIATFVDFTNPLPELQQAMETFTTAWMLDFQEKGLIPYPYVKFCDQLYYAFGFSAETNQHFCNQFEDKEQYQKFKKGMLQDLIKDLH